MYRFALLPALLLALPLCAQTSYSYTLPTQFQSLNSPVQFTFPSTPPTTGPATLTLEWAACHSGTSGGSSIYLEISTPLGWVVLLDEDDNFQSCTFQTENVTIPADVFAAALVAGGGVPQFRLDCDDSCSPGVGCTFLNDPVVRNITLAYQVRSVAFSVSEASICPGGTVTYTDQSINTPTAYAWQFPGGQPAISTLQNPVVQYAAPGSYAATLIIQTTIGPDTNMVDLAVTVQDLPPAFAGPDVAVCVGESAQLQASGGISYAWFPVTGLDDPNVPNPTVEPLSTIDYTVLVTDANGCQSSDAVTVTLQPDPVLVVDAGNNILCFGDTLQIIAQGADLYTWSPNFFLSLTSGDTVLAWPEFDVTYDLVGSDLFGCESSTSVFIDVVSQPLAPIITLVGGQLSTALTAAYQWLLNGEPIAGATEAAYIPVINGTYSVLITDPNGCQAESLPLYYGSVGMPANATAPIRIHPQPADEQVVIEGLGSNAEVRVLDALGRVQQAALRPTSGQLLVAVGSWTPGNYFIEVRDSQQVLRMPLVVQ